MQIRGGGTAKGVKREQNIIKGGGTHKERRRRGIPNELKKLCREIRQGGVKREIGNVYLARRGPKDREEAGKKKADRQRAEIGGRGTTALVKGGLGSGPREKKSRDTRSHSGVNGKLKQIRILEEN